MNVDVPDSVAADDIIVVTAHVDNPAFTVTGLPTGFAQAPDSPVAGGSNRLYVMWKRATGADDTSGTYDFTLSGSTYRNAQAIRYTGAATSGDPWDVTDSAVDNTTGSGTSPPVSDTTTVADTLLVYASTNWAGGAWTPPSGFTERRDSGDRVCTVDDLAQAAAGATGSISATCAGTDRRTAWLGALKPAAVAPSEITADAPVDLTIAATTARDSEANGGDSPVDLALAAATARDSEATANAPVALSLAATTARGSAIAAAAAVDIALAVELTDPSGVRPPPLEATGAHVAELAAAGAHVRTLDAAGSHPT